MSLTITKDTLTPGLKDQRFKILRNGERAINAGMQTARASIVQKAPVVTSALVNSIIGRGAQKRDQVNQIKKAGPPGAEVSITGTFGTNLKYARRVEFGFVGADSLGREYNQQGQFYFTRGFNEAKGDIKREIISALHL